MTTIEDAAAISTAIENAGRPLTLTEAGHAARISRFRTWRAVRSGVGDGTFTYVRVGSRWLIDNIGIPDI